MFDVQLISRAMRNKPVDYMPQLDGLRTVAVCSVFVEHWFTFDSVWFIPGEAGVMLFFVLSGFLITKILLQAKGHARGEVLLSMRQKL